MPWPTGIHRQFPSASETRRWRRFGTLRSGVMRVCVCTVVHHPEDARILHRQIRALIDAGHHVTYMAPFRACNVTPWPDLVPVDVPRATGRRRLHALREARRALKEHGRDADLVLLHDPEL